MQKPLGGHPLRSVSLGFAFLQNLRGTPLAILSLGFGSYLMQKPLGGHPLRSVSAKTSRGTPLAICGFGI